MFKLLVFCAFLAAASAKPDWVIPTAYSTTIVEPAKTTITKQASSVIHPSPVVYSAAYPVVKSSPEVALTSYITPSTYSYLNSAPLVTRYLDNVPVVRTSSIISAEPVLSSAHLIKKRSAALVAAPLITPTTYVASTPLATTYSTSYFGGAPLLSTSYGYVPTTHFIKKRSVPLVTSYVAPNVYSAPWYPNTYAAAAPVVSAPLISTSPFVYDSYFLKK